MTHTLRLLHYTGPPLVDPIHPSNPPFTPQSVYVVGFRATRQNVEIWTPMAFALNINRAIELVNILNGGNAPVNIKQWWNVMTMETPTTVITPPIVATDDVGFPYGGQWGAEEIPLPHHFKGGNDEAKEQVKRPSIIAKAREEEGGSQGSA